jgi:hypothetical protein
MLDRSPEHLSHYTGLTTACRWAPGMYLDASDSVAEPLNCWQREMTETSMPGKDIFQVNFLPNASVYLTIVVRIQCIENHRVQLGRISPEN